MSAATDALADAADMATYMADQWWHEAAKAKNDPAWREHCEDERLRALDRAAGYRARKALLEITAVDHD